MHILVSHYHHLIGGWAGIAMRSLYFQKSLSFLSNYPLVCNFFYCFSAPWRIFFVGAGRSWVTFHSIMCELSECKRSSVLHQIWNKDTFSFFFADITHRVPSASLIIPMANSQPAQILICLKKFAFCFTKDLIYKYLKLSYCAGVWIFVSTVLIVNHASSFPYTNNAFAFYFCICNPIEMWMHSHQSSWYILYVHSICILISHA